MLIYKVLDHVEHSTTRQNPDGSVEETSVHILECYGLETDKSDKYTQFTIHTNFPQAYRINVHMRKPTLNPYHIEDGES